MSDHSSYDNQRLTITREFDAPRPVVFDAWIETSKVQLWWGCADAESVESTIKPEVGGQYSHTMHIKNVGAYRYNGIITAYEPPELLAYRLHDRFHEEPMMVRVEFIDKGEKTTVHLTQDNLPETYCSFIQLGWAEGLDKLSAYLTTTKGVAHRPISS